MAREEIKNILIDSCVWLSAYSTDDPNHKQALKDLAVLNDSEISKWITEHILDEVLNILLKRSNYRGIKFFLELIKTNQILLFTPNSRRDTEKLRQSVFARLINQDKNKNQGKNKASFTDIYSLVLRDEEYIPNVEILSYDKLLG